MNKASSECPSPNTPSPRAGTELARSVSESWLVATTAAASATSDNSCVNDVETFARTVAAVKSKSAACARPDLLASVLSHYVAKWLPDVAAAPPASSSSPSDLEARAACRLDQASLAAVMISAFGHAGALLLDVPILLRLLRGLPMTTSTKLQAARPVSSQSAHG